MEQHVASVNGSTEQRGEQHFQPHVAQHVQQNVSECESTIMSANKLVLEPCMELEGTYSNREKTSTNY